MSCDNYACNCGCPDVDALRKRLAEAEGLIDAALPCVPDSLYDEMRAFLAKEKEKDNG